MRWQLLIVLLAASPLAGCDKPAPQLPKKTGVVLVVGVQEPEELKVEPMKVWPTPPTDKMFNDALQKAGGKFDPQTTLPIYDRILASHTDWANGYSGRAAMLCERGNAADQAAILSDITEAISYWKSGSSALSLVDLLTLRAKIEHNLGDDAHALADIERAIATDPANAKKVINSGAIAPEKTSNICVWNQTDANAIVARFPNDYRPYLFRGLYDSFFIFFNLDKPLGTELSKESAGDFDKAIALSQNLPIAHFIRASAIEAGIYFSLNNMAQGEQNEIRTQWLTDLSSALALDPKFVPARQMRGDIYQEMKRYGDAIQDFSSVIELDSKNTHALMARAESEEELGKLESAISDYDQAIVGYTASLNNNDDTLMLREHTKSAPRRT